MSFKSISPGFCAPLCNVKCVPNSVKCSVVVRIYYRYKEFNRNLQRPSTGLKIRLPISPKCDPCCRRLHLRREREQLKGTKASSSLKMALSYGDVSSYVNRLSQHVSRSLRIPPFEQICKINETADMPH